MKSYANNHVCEIQTWLRDRGLAGLVIPSTDEFQSEFSPPANRRLKWATGFRGSTGVAVVLQDEAALFLDGRYRLQGIADTLDTAISVQAAGWTSRREWLKRSLPPHARIGLVPRLHSMPDLLNWRNLAIELAFELEILSENPVDLLWRHDRPADVKPTIVDYPVACAGDSRETKCATLIEHVRNTGLEALLVADPEDVSWMLNVRAADEAIKTEVGEWHVVPSCLSRALVRRDGSIAWFVESDRIAADILKRDGPAISVASPDSLSTALEEVSGRGLIGSDLRRTPSPLVTIVEKHGKMRADDIVARLRWRKHAREIESARRAHIMDAVAVIRFMAWLARTVPKRVVCEFEAAQTLETFRAENPNYKGPSMPLMSASGPSGALPHYVPRRESSRKLNDHPIYWMDSGGHYPGGSTDNTITLAVGTPEPKHVLAHTLVLRGFISLTTSHFPAGIQSYRLDTITRQALWSEGLDFDHSTGHGVGNVLNIHEGPQIGREPGPTAVAIEAGMIVTNEPGYYAAGDFGLRIESHMVVVPSRHPGFLVFETISRLPIDPRLVDFELLSRVERAWLADYHRTVLSDMESLLDADAATWLRGLVQTFVDAV